MSSHKCLLTAIANGCIQSGNIRRATDSLKGLFRTHTQKIILVVALYNGVAKSFILALKIEINLFSS